MDHLQSILKRSFVSGNFLKNRSISTGATSPTKYKRADYKYEGYRTHNSVGFYTKKLCRTNIDHVVSIKDANASGAHAWNAKTKQLFSNDKKNHVESCVSVNSSKGASTPKEFLQKSSDRIGLDWIGLDWIGLQDSDFL